MPKCRSLNFFIVDDDGSVIRTMTALLKKAGHKVAICRNGKTALKEIIKARPDFISIAIMMPGMDGLELIKKLRAVKALDKTKIIILSGKAYEFDRKRSMEFGADAFITKPLNPDIFLDHINRICEDKVDVSFFGVRGTLPVPGKDAIKYGGNTSCVAMEFPKGQFFIFDAGSGIKKLSDKLLAQNRRRIDAHIFISHPHWDHINALPFFIPLYVQGNKFTFYGSSHGNLSTRELISAQMDGVYFPITIHEFASHVEFNDIKEETFKVDGITIDTMMLSHPGYCLGFRVHYKERIICYITDNELFPKDNENFEPGYVKKLLKFIHGADMLITDCTYADGEYAARIGWGHSPVSAVVDLANRAKAKNLYMFHHDPNQTDRDIDAKFKTARNLLKKKKSKTRVFAPAEGTMVKV
ncbi:MAG TPA: response regulator [Alphaproteobacteria bacterium]|nr:response regulator [Alphaproteobacteria bacterium]